MEHIGEDIKLYPQVQFNYKPRKAHQSSDPMQVQMQNLRSRQRSELIFGSTLLLSTLPVRFGREWYAAALQFICKAYPKMLMGLLYVVDLGLGICDATAGGISQCPGRSLSF